MSHRPIRLLLVDDHLISREPLAMLLDREAGLTVVGEAGSLSEARELISAGLAFDIAIVNLDLCDGSGLDVIRDICTLVPDAQVLALTRVTDERIHGCAILKGASGILSIGASTVDVIAAIRKLAAGDSLMPPAEASALLARGRQYQRKEEMDRRALDQLSLREREVLRAMAAGFSNEAIAAKMCIGTETVRSHVAKILHKLGATSRLQAAIIAIQRGYAGDDDAIS